MPTSSANHSDKPEKNNLSILIADDDPDIVEFVTYNLSREGYEVFSANDGSTAIQLAKAQKPDLIILDVMMPEMDGIEVCRELRSHHIFQNTVITFLTARSEDYSQIAGFDSGGDDYITKPIRPRLLISRINALLRRKSAFKNGTPANESLDFGNLIIDKTRFSVRLNDTSIELARKEFEILYLLASYPSRVFTREEIFSRVWGQDVRVGLRTIDVHIRKLRAKVGENFIHTIKGIGYKFEY